jgi:PleD family two-component response regulator
MNLREDRRPSVLIVEDIDWIRSSMKRAVERQGYHVLEATNDEEAITIAETVRPALILTEEAVPNFDVLLRCVQEHSMLRGVPVVIIYPDADENTRFGNALVLTDYEQLDGVLLRDESTRDE